MKNQQLKKPDNIAEVKRIFYRILNHWPLLVIFIFLSLSTAILVNRYTPPVYAISSSILIKDHQEANDNAAELLYGNQLFNNSRNLNNEAILLTSYPLIYHVLKELNYDKVFLKEGNVRTSEAFVDAPAKVLVDTTSSFFPYGRDIIFQFKEGNTFSISIEGEEEHYESANYEFYDLIDYEGFRFRVFPNETNHRKLANKKYIFQLLSLHHLTNDYRSRLKITPVSRDASILALSITGTVPEKEVRFLNQLINTYTQQGVD